MAVTLRIEFMNKSNTLCMLKTLCTAQLSLFFNCGFGEVSDFF